MISIGVERMCVEPDFDLAPNLGVSHFHLLAPRGHKLFDLRGCEVFHGRAQSGKEGQGVLRQRGRSQHCLSEAVHAERHPHFTLPQRADEIMWNANAEVEDGSSSNDVRAAQADPLCTRRCTKTGQRLSLSA